MLITFSSQVPIEATSNDEKFSPFKTFVIENTEDLLKRKFLKKENRSPSFPIPECYICGMHFSTSSEKKKKEGKWICRFCGKENLHDQLDKLVAFTKFYQKQENCDSETDTLMESDISKLRNLIILVMDFGCYMGTAVLKSKNQMDFKEWMKEVISRDLEKYPSSSKFLLILCNTEVSILNNDPQAKEPIIIGYPHYKDVNYCFKTGENLAQDLMIGDMNNPKYLNRKLNQQEFKGLSSIGVGFAVALGIIHKLDPINHKIVIIGEGVSYFGACRSVDFELSREVECCKELELLYKQVKNPHELRIQAFDLGENKSTDNFFLNLKQVFKKTKILNASRGDNIGDLDLFPEKASSSQNEYILQLATSPNIVLIPYENLVVEKNLYNFQEKRKVFRMNNVDPNKQFYPFHFEFVAGKTLNSSEIVIQAEFKVRKEQTLTIFVTTKILQIAKFKKIDYAFMNFSVSNYCYCANDFFQNKLKREGLLKLINEYLENKGKTQIPLLKALKYNIENVCKVLFEVKFSEGPDLKESALMALTKKNQPKLIDFMKIERISEKKMKTRR